MPLKIALCIFFTKDNRTLLKVKLQNFENIPTHSKFRGKEDIVNIRKKNSASNKMMQSKIIAPLEFDFNNKKLLL